MMEQEKLSAYMKSAQALELFIAWGGAGDVFWKPNGVKLYENLKNYIWAKHQKYSYQRVKSPMVVPKNLFEISGHMDKYSSNIFSISEQLALRPMSCPNHIVLYDSVIQSHQSLPVKYFEFGDVFRQESSGSLQVLFRQRQFCQDDAHIFAKKSQLLDLIGNYLDMAKEVYGELGFSDIKYCVSLRPQKRFGEDWQWDEAEQVLFSACRSRGLEVVVQPGEGAFYGPKIELQVKDSINRWWQLGVIQLDYVLAKRFELSYIDESNEKQPPVILHHAVLGSLERMIGVMLESFRVHLPEFLHPIPAVVVPVSEKQLPYAREIKSYNLECKGGYKEMLVDESNESLSKKIQKWVSLGVPNIFVVGQSEQKNWQENHQMIASKREKNANVLFNFQNHL